MAKRARPQSEAETDTFTVTPLGAGHEVGRSCIIVKYKGKTVMLDCGIRPNFRGELALPYFDNMDLSEVDLVLVTHFHLDHVAALPNLMRRRSGFRARVFMTAPTKAVMHMLLSDYIRVTKNSDRELLFSETDLRECLAQIETVDFNQQLEVSGIKFQCFNAGHVLGAAMFMLEIDERRLLYTGDYSVQEDRHLVPARLPPSKPHVLVIESTSGVRNHEEAGVREKRLTTTVRQVLERGGNCLLPAFALGRAQEVLLILEEYWEQNPSMHKYPIFLASGIADDALKLFRGFTSVMNQRVQAAALSGDPFAFPHIRSLRSLRDLDRVAGPCVVMASPGFLERGMSRTLAERWCADARNGIVIVGYTVDGTLARDLLVGNLREVPALDGSKLPLRATVDEISFSAHADCSDTQGFIRRLRPTCDDAILVHGAETEMSRLSEVLVEEFNTEGMHVYTPRNEESVVLTYEAKRSAKVVGSLAKRPVQDGAPLGGVVVSRHFQRMVMAPEDLGTYTKLHTAELQQRQHMPFHQTLALLEVMLRAVYGDVETTTRNGQPCLKLLGGAVTARLAAEHRLTVEWSSSAMNDMVADSVLAFAAQAECSPLSLRVTSMKHEHAGEKEGADAGAALKTE